MKTLYIFATELEQGLKKIKDANVDLNVTSILNWVYAISGIIAVGYIVYGAVNYVNSQGDASKAKQAAQTLVWAVIGLGVIILATAITNFAISAATLK